MDNDECSPELLQERLKNQKLKFRKVHLERVRQYTVFSKIYLFKLKLQKRIFESSIVLNIFIFKTVNQPC